MNIERIDLDILKEMSESRALVKRNSIEMYQRHVDVSKNKKETYIFIQVTCIMRYVLFSAAIVLLKEHA